MELPRDYTLKLHWPDCSGMVAGIESECWPDSYRKGGRFQAGMVDGFVRNTHLEQVAISFQNRRFASSMNEMANGGNITTLIDLYVRDKDRKWEPRTKKKQVFSLGLFVKLAGEKDVKEFLLDDFISFKETLSYVPANFSRAKKLKRRDLKELISENKADYEASIKLGKEEIEARRSCRYDLLDLRTQGCYLEMVTWFFNWLVEKSYLLQTYASKLGYDEATINSKNIRPYTVDELQKIINTLPIKSSKPEQFFIPLLGLYDAIRLNEGCQPLVRDVVIDPVSGLLCLSINDDKEFGQRVKNRTSKRVIPIPQLLLDLGFQNYLAEMQKKDTNPKKPLQLFPALKLGKNGFTGAMSNWWSRFVDESVTKDDAVDFRSLRTNLTNELHKRGYVDPQIQPLIGHAATTTLGKHYIYNKPALMFEMLKCVDYGIDLSRLYRESPWISASDRKKLLKDGVTGRC